MPQIKLIKHKNIQFLLHWNILLCSLLCYTMENGRKRADMREKCLHLGSFVKLNHQQVSFHSTFHCLTFMFNLRFNICWICCVLPSIFLEMLRIRIRAENKEKAWVAAKISLQKPQISFEENKANEIIMRCE